MAKRPPKPFEVAVAEMGRAPVGANGCKHPPDRLWAWMARDDTVPGGELFCVTCCVCGGVLAGRGTSGDDDAE